MKKISKKVLAAALVLTLAVPSAVSFAADGDTPAVDLPEPLAELTMDADSLTATGYKDLGGTAAVADREMGTVLEVSASTGTVNSEASFNNPFKGAVASEMQLNVQNSVLKAEGKLDEFDMPVWNEGVMINYWIKTAGTDNSPVLTFQNKDRVQVQKDDMRECMVCAWAEKAIADGDTDPLFALSKTYTYVDAEGTEYLVYDGQSDFMEYRPDYVAGYVKDDSGTITVHPKTPDADHPAGDIKVSFLANRYEVCHEWDITKNDKSLVCYGYSDGFMQLSMDGGFGFLEDTIANKAGKVSLNTHEGASTRGSNFNGDNKLVVQGTNADGESDVIDLLTPNEWHMVTVQIQNDSYELYIDGEWIDMQTGTFNYYGKKFPEDTMAGSAFNGGFGFKYAGRGTARRGDTDDKAGFGAMGTRCSILMVDWLALNETTFSIGGVIDPVMSEDGATKLKFGSADGGSQPGSVAEFRVDDVSFYGELLDEDQIGSLYQAGLDKIKENLKGTGDVNGKDGVTSSDALEVLKVAAKLATFTADQENVADTNLDGNIDSKDALNMLRYAAQMIDTLPVRPTE